MNSDDEIPLHTLGKKLKKHTPKVQYQKHQLEAIEKFKKSNGLLMVWPTGSGKTIGSLGCSMQYLNNKLVVVPAPLIENYVKELRKFGGKVIEKARTEKVVCTVPKQTSSGELVLDDQGNEILVEKTIKTFTPTTVKAYNTLENGHCATHVFSIYTYEYMARWYNKIDYTDFILVCDEAHRLRNDNLTSKAIRYLGERAFKRVLMTATPLQNSIDDLVIPLGIVTDNHLQAKEYVKEPSNVSEYLHFVTEKFNDDYPRLEKQDVKVPLSKIHSAAYRSLLAKKLNQKDLLMFRKNKDIKRIRQLLAFQHAPRVACNIIQTGDSKVRTNKIDEIVNQIVRVGGYEYEYEMEPKTELTELDRIMGVKPLQIRKVDGEPVIKGIKRVGESSQQLVYSNFLSNGLYLIRDRLEALGISFAMHTGSMSKVARDKSVKQFNDGAVEVLMISSSGSEGLDLKNTQYVHICEPHFNDARINQVIGRARRYHSHHSLPVEKRFVMIFRYISELYIPMSVNEPWYGDLSETTDATITRIAKERFEQFRHYLLARLYVASIKE